MMSPERQRERIGRERERSSIIVHTLAAQSRSGLGRTGQGRAGVQWAWVAQFKTSTYGKQFT